MSLLDQLNLSEGVETQKDKKLKEAISETLGHVEAVDLKSKPLLNKSPKPRKKRKKETKPRKPKMSKEEKAEQFHKDKKKWEAIITGERYKMTKYREEYCEELVSFFAEAQRYRVETEKTFDKDGNLIKETEKRLPCAPPLFSSFATKIGVHTVTLNRWRKEFKAFDEAYLIAKDIQASHIVSNSMEDLNKGSFPTFMMKNNHNWTDKVEQKVQTVKTLEDTINESFQNDIIEVENEYKPREIEHNEDI